MIGSNENKRTRNKQKQSENKGSQTGKLGDQTGSRTYLVSSTQISFTFNIQSGYLLSNLPFAPGYTTTAAYTKLNLLSFLYGWLLIICIWDAASLGRSGEESTL